MYLNLFKQSLVNKTTPYEHIDRIIMIRWLRFKWSIANKRFSICLHLVVVQV